MNQGMSDWERKVWFEWGRLHKYIKAALPYLNGEMTEEDLRAGVIDGTLQLWPLDDGFIITSEEVHERLKHLSIVLVGGDWPQIAAMLEPLKEYAKEKHCTNLINYSRLGFWRSGKLQKLGFKPIRVVFQLEL